MSVRLPRIPHEHAQVIVDPKAYADGRIFDTYAWLRANLPIGLAEPDGFDAFWVITRYEDLRSISVDSAAFHSGDRPIVLTDKVSEALMRKLSGDKPYFARSLVQMDPPDHLKYRRLTQKCFAPKQLKLLEEQIAGLAGATVGRMQQLGGSCDFVEAVALHYPLEVVMQILGVPSEELPFMLKLTQEMFAPRDPDSVPEGVDLNDPSFLAAAMKTTTDQLEAFFSKITAERRREPRNDVATVIANAEIDGQPIPDIDTLGYYIIIATAGHDTTSSSTAAAMYGLASQPDLLARLKADPSLIPAFVEEAIRWAAPVKTFMRSVAADVEFQGVPFRKNDWIMLCYASANRDENVIQGAQQFDIDRPKFAHVSFGYGAHVCIGQYLARLEMRILFEKLIPALKSVALAGEVEMSQSFFVNGAKHLPIRFELETPAVQVPL